MADLQDLLIKTSRTFALSIPLLPEPCRGQVTLAYLLFRIADTFEDAADWGPSRRREALDELARVIEHEVPEDTRRLADRCLVEPPVRHAGYCELLRAIPEVVEQYWRLPERARAIIGAHLGRTIRGMAGFVARTDTEGHLELRDLQDLRDYCYYVAGIVGEMLTELFVLEVPGLEPEAAYLRERARDFGEGLQLTNILKDAAGDAAEGRSYMPRGVRRAEVFELARRDLLRAAEYVAALQRTPAPRGLIEFNALPVLLARATLERVEARGPGSKIARSEVFALVGRMNEALDGGQLAVPY